MGDPSWLDEGLKKELDVINLNDPRINTFEEREDPAPYEELLKPPQMTDVEKKYYILSLVYNIRSREAEAKGNNNGMNLCELRARMLWEMFYFRVAERFRIWEWRGEIEIGVRSGWRIVRIDEEVRRKYLLEKRNEKKRGETVM